MREVASILPLDVRDVGFSVQGKELLSGLSFKVPRGGVTVLLGANGAGKSLTLRLCHGLLEPTAGAVNWAVENGILAGRKRHAMVFQNPVMLRRSARANITHALAAAGIGWRERGALAHAALERFGLAHLAGHAARTLSGGEKQRLAIARAFALKPEVLFLDEPSSALDPSAARQIEEMLTALRGEGVTLVMSTHDLGQARRLADTVLFLNRGKLVECGPASEFFSNPASPEAHAFLNGDLLW